MWQHNELCGLLLFLLNLNSFASIYSQTPNITTHTHALSLSLSFAQKELQASLQMLIQALPYKLPIKRSRVMTFTVIHHGARR